MTKAGAIYNFWSSFGLTAHEENAVPPESAPNAPQFPYITYSLTTDSFGNEVLLNGSLWYNSTSWTEANAKEKEISTDIGSGGKFVDFDGGRIWLKRGTPFANRMSDDSETNIKRILLNVLAEFLSVD